jgi:hypothetical protein
MRLLHLQTYLLRPWVLTLFSAWFYPSLRLGPLALIRL